MNITLRQESPADYKAVFNLIEKAFRNEEYSDHREHFLVERLRMSPAFIPELSIVAEKEKQIAGHILLTRIRIKSDQAEHESLALAPVTVLPEFQGKGIGGKLIRYAHEKAKTCGYTSIVLLGHKDYYPKFGYKPAAHFGIRLPFDAPEENCMAIELVESALEKAQGTVEYPGAFFE